MELNSIYHHTKFESNRLINVRMRANVNDFDAVSKTAVISLVSLTVTKKQYQNVQLQLRQRQIKFHLDELKSLRENEAKRLCFALAF